MKIQASERSLGSEKDDIYSLTLNTDKQPFSYKRPPNQQHSQLLKYIYVNIYIYNQIFKCIYTYIHK